MPSNGYFITCLSCGKSLFVLNDARAAYCRCGYLHVVDKKRARDAEIAERIFGKKVVFRELWNYQYYGLDPWGRHSYAHGNDWYIREDSDENCPKVSHILDFDKWNGIPSLIKEMNSKGYTVEITFVNDADCACRVHQDGNVIAYFPDGDGLEPIGSACLAAMRRAVSAQDERNCRKCPENKLRIGRDEDEWEALCADARFKERGLIPGYKRIKAYVCCGQPGDFIERPDWCPLGAR